MTAVESRNGDDGEVCLWLGEKMKLPIHYQSDNVGVCMTRMFFGRRRQRLHGFRVPDCRWEQGGWLAWIPLCCILS